MILNSYINQNTFTYEVKSNGLKASTDSNGTMFSLITKENKVFFFENSFMTDANGKYSDKVSLKLRQADGKTFVDVTADDTFLKDQTTAYPVTIDPTIDSWNILSDTFISASKPDKLIFQRNIYVHRPQRPAMHNPGFSHVLSTRSAQQQQNYKRQR